jgi:N-acetyl-gamma-glutamyl-phosphate reductase
MATEKSRAAIWGAGGYVGGELLRLVACHPKLELTAALSDTHAGKKVGDVFPNLAPFTDLMFESQTDWPFDKMKDGASWTLFAALGHVETMNKLGPVVRALKGANVKIVDLSGDFRLQDPAAYLKYYEHEHTEQALLPTFVYGLPELYREKIKQAACVANPGCFATACQLSMLPMAAAPVKTLFVAVDAKTGSSGGGIKPASTTHHPYRMNNYSAYKQFSHQHFPEIAGGWQGAGGSKDTEISFVPQRAPLVRGIFVTSHFFMEQAVTKQQAAAWYKEFYASHPFVRMIDKSPFISDIWGTNVCGISVTAEGKKVVVCAAIDNLMKGAAGQAVQNANLMQGWNETDGLLMPAPSPM